MVMPLSDDALLGRDEERTGPTTYSLDESFLAKPPRIQMKLGDSAYDKLVRKHMHKLTVLTEKECAEEIAAISGGIFDGRYIPPASEPSQNHGPILAEPPLKKRRGRPPGSKNRPK